MAETDAEQSPAASTTGTAVQPPAITYDGEMGPLAKLGIKVSLLTLVTLGFYRFWGKTRIRQYLWSRISVFGNRLEYTGTGKELFLGFLIVLAVLMPFGMIVGLLQLAAGTDGILLSTIEFLQIIVLLYLIGYATYRARRYRMSRTLLRGIRFRQGGSAGKFAFKWFGYLILTFFTLGIARPWGDVAVHRYTMTNSWFGAQNFSFDGRPREMLKTWIICLLLATPTLGLSLVWYAAFKTRYLVGGTRFQNLPLSLRIEFMDLVKIYLVALFALLLLLSAIMMVMVAVGAAIGASAGSIFAGLPISVFIAIVVFGSTIALVFLTHPMLLLIADRFSVEGDVDFEAILQNADTGPRTGEGLADALDVGGGLEVGL